MAESSKSRSDGSASASERIPRRPLPEFEETDAPMIQGILDGGFLRVALKDVNQYGPHAMIMLLFVVATVTAIALLLIPTLNLEIWMIIAAPVIILGAWTGRTSIRRMRLQLLLRLFR